jgi:hypothetical protein
MSGGATRTARTSLLGRRARNALRAAHVVAPAATHRRRRSPRAPRPRKQSAFRGGSVGAARPPQVRALKRRRIPLRRGPPSRSRPHCPRRPGFRRRRRRPSPVRLARRSDFSRQHQIERRAACPRSVRRAARRRAEARRPWRRAVYTESYPLWSPTLYKAQACRQADVPSRRDRETPRPPPVARTALSRSQIRGCGAQSPKPGVWSDPCRFQQRPALSRRSEACGASPRGRAEAPQ